MNEEEDEEEQEEQEEEDGMWLSPLEQQWALDLRAAIEACPELDPLSDFMYAQIAIYQGGDLEKGLEMATTMQGF